MHAQKNTRTDFVTAPSALGPIPVLALLQLHGGDDQVVRDIENETLARNFGVDMQRVIVHQ